jgi:hypothetical protein
MTAVQENQITASNVHGIDVAHTVIRNHRVATHPIGIASVIIEPSIWFNWREQGVPSTQLLQMNELSLVGETWDDHYWVKDCLLEKLKEALPNVEITQKKEEHGIHTFIFKGATLQDVANVVAGLLVDSKAASQLNEAAEHVQAHLRNYYLRNIEHVSGYFEFKDGESWEQAVARDKATRRTGAQLG